MSEPKGRFGVTRWTDRTYLFLTAGGLLLGAAVALRDPVPIFFGLALLLAPFAAAWSYPRSLGEVELSWQETGTGPQILIRGTLTGAFGSSAGDVSVQFAPPVGVVVERRLGYVREPGEVRFGTDWRSLDPYPSHRLAAVVRWSDPLGLGERILEGARPELPVVRNPPELRSVAALQLARATPLPGELRTRRLGIGSEFVALRLAEPGESVRRINWRATARTGKLIANEYETELRADVLLLLDLRPTSQGWYVDELVLRLGRAACLGLVRPFLRAKLRVGFATFGEEVAALPLSSGRVHAYRVAEAIQASRLAERDEPPLRCVAGLRRQFPPGTSTVIVSGWTDDPTGDLAPYLRRAGYPVVTFSPSPLPMRESTGRLDPNREALARRLERLERRTRLAPLWNYGPVVDWEDYGSLEGLRLALRAFGRRKLR